MQIGNSASSTATRALQASPDVDFAAGQAFADINEPFEAIVEDVAKALTEIGTENVKAALRSLGIKDPGILNEAIAEVAKYSRDRAAQMVGKQWLANTLIDDPAAEMAITSLTQKGIADSVKNVLEAFTSGEIDELSTAAMTEELLSQYAFSADRAKLITAFESQRVANKGYLAAWTASGVVTGKYSVLSPNHDMPDVCDDIEAMGVVDVDSTFGGYGFGPPWHPGPCECRIVAVRADEDVEDYLDEALSSVKATTIRAKALDLFELAKSL